MTFTKSILIMNRREKKEMARRILGLAILSIRHASDGSHAFLERKIVRWPLKTRVITCAIPLPTERENALNLLKQRYSLERIGWERISKERNDFIPLFSNYRKNAQSWAFYCVTKYAQKSYQSLNSALSSQCSFS